MSLILEALKKIERDKQAPERGVVVLASAALASPPARSRVPAVALVAAGLALAAVVGWRSWRPAPAEARRAEDGPVARAESAPAPIAVAPVVPVTVAPARVAPPVTPAATSPPKPATLHLSAIGAREGQPVAVINDQVVQVGDVVGNARVVAIEGTTVELDVDGVRQRLTF